MKGNYAAEVLADLEKHGKEKKRLNAMKELDREIKGYLSFNSNFV
jgi:hypothetical protein